MLNGQTLKNFPKLIFPRYTTAIFRVSDLQNELTIYKRILSGKFPVFIEKLDAYNTESKQIWVGLKGRQMSNRVSHKNINHQEPSWVRWAVTNIIILGI